MNLQKLTILNLIRRPGRTAALALLTAILALSLFGGSVCVLSLNQGLKSLESRLGADIIVVPSSAQSKVSFQNMLLQGTAGAFYMKEENLDRVLEVEGVEKAAAQVFLASLKADCCSARIQVIGFDQDTDFVVWPWIEESYAKTLKDMEIVAGANVEAGLGETLRIYDERCPVVARLAPTGTGLDTAVYCTMETMKVLLQAAEAKGITHKIDSNGQGGISAVYVKVKEGYDIGKVNSAIQGHTRKASAIRTKSMLTDVSGSLSGIASAVRMLILAIWVLTFVILVISFAMIANERRKEFALLRLLGVSRRRLGGIIWRETAIVSLAGGLMGIAAACAMLFPFAMLIETKLKLPYLTPSFSRILLLGILSLAADVAVGSLASAFSVRRLSRVDPGMALRENE